MNLVTFFKTSSALKDTKNTYAFLLNAPNQPVQMSSASQSPVLQSSVATNLKNVDDADDSWMDSFMKPSGTKPSVMTTRLTWKTQPTAAGADKVDKADKVEEEIKKKMMIVTKPRLHHLQYKNKCGNGILEPLNLPEPDKCSCR